MQLEICGLFHIRSSLTDTRFKFTLTVCLFTVKHDYIDSVKTHHCEVIALEMVTQLCLTV